MSQHDPWEIVSCLKPRRIVTALGAVLVGGLLLSCTSYQGKAQDVTFVSHDGVELAGTLVLPKGVVGHPPVAVILHGAEAATRSQAYRMHANVLLARGWAVLLYDKRGAGESGGDHDEATYADLIEDALAAIAWLRRQSHIDTTRMGLIGTSESVWLTPEIAERAGGLEFVFNKSGSSLSWRETNAWEIYNELRAEGVDSELAWAQVDVFRALWAHHVSPTPTSGARVEALLATWAGRSDSRLPARLEPVPPSYAQDIAYNPAPFLQRLQTPMLYVFGSEDVNVPTAWCVTRLQTLKDAGYPVSFHVFDGEGHELGGVGVGGYEFVPGYARLLGDFAAHNFRGTR